MSTTYRHLPHEVGCLSAEIYKEIRRCLRLRGGVMHDGIKWIWKTSEELADRFGCNEKTIRRHLKGLVEMGWLKREQLQKRWGMRAYHYSLGDDAPLKLNGRHLAPKARVLPNGYVAQPVEHLHGMAVSPLHNTRKKEVSSSASQQPFQTRLSDRTEADKMSGSINRNTTSTNSLPGQNSPNSQGAARQTEKGIGIRTGFKIRCDDELDPTLAFKTRAINHSTTESQTSKQQDIKNREGGIRTHGSSINEGGIRSLSSSVKEGGIGTLNDIATTGISRRSDLYKPQMAELVDALVSGTSGALKLPSHWPEENMSLSLKVQVIEAARQLAFPGRRAASYGSC